MKESDTIYGSGYYTDNHQESDRIMLWFYARYAKKYLKKFIGKNTKQCSVLDYGCGTGHLVKRLNRFRTYGFDISKYAVETAKYNSSDTIFISSLSDIKDHSLNMIITLHVLEHIEEPMQILQQFFNKLEVGGYLLFVVPNKSAFGYKKKKENWFAFRDKTHVSLLGDPEWFQMLEQVGFKIVKAGTDGPWDSPYWTRIPLWMNKLFTYFFCAPQIILNILFLPMRFGEDLILVSRKPF